MSDIDHQFTETKKQFTDANGKVRFVLDTLDFSKNQIGDIGIEIKFQSSVFTDQEYIALPAGENSFKVRIIIKLNISRFLFSKLINSASLYKLPKKVLNLIIKKIRQSNIYFSSFSEREIVDNLNFLLLKIKNKPGFIEKLNNLDISQVNEQNAILGFECFNESRPMPIWKTRFEFSGKLSSNPKFWVKYQGN